MIPVILALLLLSVLYWLFMSPYSQVFGKFPYKAKTNDKKIALSFDDGPNEPYTSQIVDYLNDKNIKATFFQVGKCVERFPEITRKIDQFGHLVGNHSLSHQFRKYFTEPNYEQELSGSQAIFERVLGKTPACFRPPWLWRYPRLFKSLNKYNLQPVSGEFCHVLEVFQPSAERIARRTLAKINPGTIVIFHDGFNAKGADRTQTVAAVKIVVEECLRLGYEFVTVDKLLGLKSYFNS